MRSVLAPRHNHGRQGHKPLRPAVRKMTGQPIPRPYNPGPWFPYRTQTSLLRPTCPPSAPTGQRCKSFHNFLWLPPHLPVPARRRTGRQSRPPRFPGALAACPRACQRGTSTQRAVVAFPRARTHQAARSCRRLFPAASYESPNADSVPLTRFCPARRSAVAAVRPATPGRFSRSPDICSWEFGSGCHAGIPRPCR